MPVDLPVYDIVLATERGFSFGPDGVTLAAESGAVARVVVPELIAPEAVVPETA